jgi:hypothetical protein
MAALLADRPRAVAARPGGIGGFRLSDSDRPRRPAPEEPAARPAPVDAGRVDVGPAVRPAPVESTRVDAGPVHEAPPTVAADIPADRSDLPDEPAAPFPPADVPPWQNPGRHGVATGPRTNPVTGAPTPGYGFDDPIGHVLAHGSLADEAVDEDLADEPPGLERATARRRLVVYGVPVLALAIVIGLAVWLGSSVLSVANDVSTVQGSTPSSSGQSGQSASSSSASASPSAGRTLPVVGATVFDPKGDGDPDNAREANLAHDGNPATVWSTYEYRGSAAFGNLKPGVGVLFDLGNAQPLAGVTIATTLPGSSVEVRTGSRPDGQLEDYSVAGTATLNGSTKVSFSKAVTSRYVLVWFTRLVPSPGGFSANLGEVGVQRAG